MTRPAPPHLNSGRPYRVLWTVLLEALEAGHTFRMRISVRAGNESEAVRVVLKHRPGWHVARDEYGNPIIIRHPDPVGDAPGQGR